MSVVRKTPTNRGVVKIPSYQCMDWSERACASVGHSVLQQVKGALKSHQFRARGTTKVVTLQIELD